MEQAIDERLGTKLRMADDLPKRALTSRCSGASGSCMKRDHAEMAQGIGGKGRSRGPCLNRGAGGGPWRKEKDDKETHGELEG